MSEHGQNPSSFSVVVVGTTATLLLPANPRRKGIVVSPGTTNRITIAPVSGVGDKAGMVIPANVPPVVLCCCDVGDWLRHDLYAIANAAPETIGVVEVFE